MSVSGPFLSPTSDSLPSPYLEPCRGLPCWEKFPGNTIKCTAGEQEVPAAIPRRSGVPCTHAAAALLNHHATKPIRRDMVCAHPSSDYHTLRLTEPQTRRLQVDVTCLCLFFLPVCIHVLTGMPSHSYRLRPSHLLAMTSNNEAWDLTPNPALTSRRHTGGSENIVLCATNKAPVLANSNHFGYIRPNASGVGATCDTIAQPMRSATTGVGGTTNAT